MTAWRTIESAPRDGTLILVYQPEGQWQGRRSRQVKIDTAYWHQPSNPASSGFWCGHVTDIYRPTHWQPLPPPPEEG